MSSDLESLPAVARLSPNVIRILGGNPGKFTLQGTNTYLLGDNHDRILIDTGQGEREWAERLARVLEDESAIISKVLLTHWHHDHVGGVNDVKELCPSVEVYKAQPDDGQRDLADGQKFTTSGVSLKSMRTPGHTTDHTVFISDTHEKAMFSGDNVLGHGTAVFENLEAYMHSLEEMQSACQGKIYPGHGSVVENGQEKIEEYIEHRNTREQQVADVLMTGGAMSVEEIVKLIYKDYPESLHQAAENGVLQILRKLERGGRALAQSNGWTMLIG